MLSSKRALKMGASATTDESATNGLQDDPGRWELFTRLVGRHWKAPFLLGLLLFLFTCWADGAWWSGSDTGLPATLRQRARYTEVHPFAILDLAKSEDVVDSGRLAGKPIEPVILICLSATLMLLPLAWRLEDEQENREKAERIYNSKREKNPLVKEERKRREDSVVDWSAGYAKTARSLLAIELLILILILAIRWPLDWTQAVNWWPDVIGSLYVVRFVVWFAILGFLAWVYIRPLVIESIIEPNQKTSDDGDDSQSKRYLDGTALAFSGGGIRSAAFTLGAIDALQDREQDWRRVKYVCAVSGGAYTAGVSAGLRASEKRQKRDEDEALRLKEADEALRLKGSALRHIRNHSNYLAPGILGKVRAFNDWGSGFLVTALLFAASVGTIGIVMGILAASLQWDPRSFDFGHAGWAVLAAGLVGVSATIRSHVGDPSMGWRRCGEVFGWIFAFLGFLVFVVPTFFDVIFFLARRSETLAPAVRWIAGLLAAGTLATAAVWSIVKQASAPIATFIAGLIVPLLTVAGLASTAYWAVGLNTLNTNPANRPSVWVLVLAIVAVGVLLASIWLPANEVSLNPFYRRRLSTAFALVDDGQVKDPKKPIEVKEPKRQDEVALQEIENPNEPDARSTIICAAANVMGSPISPPGRGALSFTFSGARVGLPGSEAVPDSDATMKAGNSRLNEGPKNDSRSFSLMSAVAISGAAVSPGMGKMTKRAYEALLALSNVRLGEWLPNPLDGANKNGDHEESSTKERGVEDQNIPAKATDEAKRVGGLGQGKFLTWLNRKPGRFFTWLNCKLGRFFTRLNCKLGRFFSRPVPHMFPYFYKELLGMHTILDPHLYITDGGHWDNLGLVEALRHRPSEIIVFDSSGDRPGTFATLGEAKSLAEMELGVRIDLDTTPLTKKASSTKKHWWSRAGGVAPASSRPEQCFVTGTATYDNDPAMRCSLVYCRALVTADAPVNITSFQAKHASFPNHSTLSQLYDDETFEAYRALGYHCAKSITEPKLSGWSTSLSHRVGAQDRVGSRET